MGSTPLDRAAVLQAMPPWDKRLSGQIIETWWGAVRLDKTGAARLGVVDPQVPLAAAGRAAQRVADYLDRRRFPLGETMIAAAVLASAGGGLYLIRQHGAVSLPIGIVLWLLAAFGAPGVWSPLLGRYRRLPDGAVIGPLDERAWTTVRYLNSYRHGPDEQCNTVRRLLYGIALAVATDEADPETATVLAEIHQRINGWAELPEEQVAELAGALAATRHRRLDTAA